MISSLLNVITVASEKSVHFASQSFTIFIVEDSDIYRDLLVKFLSGMARGNQEGDEYKFFSFASGEECLESMHLKPDIVIMDYNLNDEGTDSDKIDGIELLRQIRKYSPSTRVVALSRQEDLVITAEMFRQGAADYITKEPAGRARVQNVMTRLMRDIKKRRIIERKLQFAGVMVFLIGIALGAFVF